MIKNQHTLALDWQTQALGRYSTCAYHLPVGDQGHYHPLPYQGRLQDSTEQVHIHLLQPDAAKEPHYATLNATEQRQAQRFKFAKDRKLYAAAHHFVRTTLSRYADIDPADWAFRNNDYGKPRIINPGYTSLDYNLSHTQGMVAIAVTRQRAIGIDTEQARPLNDLTSLSRSVFADPEYANVMAGTGRDQQQRFFTYWTLKEAYIKARGMGLSIPLQQFHFIAGIPPQWQLQCDPALHDDGKRWHCQAIRLADHYHLAFVVDNTDSNVSG